MAIKRHLIHINNHTLTEGVPVAPQANDLMHGEIAVNYGEGGETLFIKNDKENANEIVKFSNDKYWQEKLDMLTIDIADYMPDGAKYGQEIPLEGGKWLYKGMPVSHWRLIGNNLNPERRNVDLLFCPLHFDVLEHIGQFFVHFNYNEETNDGYVYVNTYNRDDLLPNDWILESFGEAEVDNQNPGWMSVADKEKLDGLPTGTTLAQTIESNELTTSAALNDLNARLAIIEQALDLENKTIEYGTITVDGQTKNVIMWS